MKFSFFNKTKKYIKLKLSYPDYKEVKKIKNNSEKRIILIGTPIHGNLGDHLIASESINLLKDWGYNDFIEVPEFLYELFPYKIKAKKNDVILIENPEIHLHPASQAKVGEFLAFIVRAGIQVIIETHCEHLIYKVGYEIYKKRFLKDDVTILYKEGIQNPFIVLGFKEDGKFTRDFPEVFFDATLAELLEME